MDQDTAAFVALWALDEDSTKMLGSMSPEVATQVMSGFMPKNKTRDVNALFKGYARSIMNGAGGFGAGAAVAESDSGSTRGAPVPNADILAFASKWGLDDSSVASILQLSPEQRLRVLTSFAPKPGTRNVNALLLGFVRSVSAIARGQPNGGWAPSQTGPGRAAPVVSSGGSNGHASSEAQELAEAQAFIDHWGLDATSVDMLSYLSTEARHKVMRSFAPKAGTQDVNRLFQGFARSIAGAGAQGWEPVHEPVHELRAFAEQWGLGEDSLSLLMQQPLEVQQEVLSGFRPRPQTRDVNALLRGFLRSILAPRQSRDAAAADAAAADAADAADAAAFAARWALDEHCLAQLRALGPLARQRVLREFAPKPGTRDVGALFRGFVRSVAAPDAGAYCASQGLDAACLEALAALPPELQERVMGTFQPRPETRNVCNLFLSYCRSMQPKGAGKGDTPWQPSFKRARLMW